MSQNNKFGNTHARNGNTQSSSLKGKVNSLVSRYEKQESNNHQESLNHEHKKSTASQSVTPRTSRKHFPFEKTEGGFRSIGSSKLLTNDSVVLARPTPRTENGINKKQLQHRKSLDDILSPNTSERNLDILTCRIDRNNSQDKHILYRTSNSIDAYNSYQQGHTHSRITNHNNLYSGDKIETKNTFSQFDNPSGLESDPRSLVNYTKRCAHPTIPVSKNKLQNAESKPAVDRSSCTNSSNSDNTKALHAPWRQTEVPNRSRSRVRKSDGERDDSWIKHRSKSVPAYIESKKSNIPRDTHKNPRNYERLVSHKRTENQYVKPNNLTNHPPVISTKLSNYEELQPAVQETNHVSSNCSKHYEQLQPNKPKHCLNSHPSANQTRQNSSLLTHYTETDNRSESSYLVPVQTRPNTSMQNKSTDSSIATSHIMPNNARTSSIQHNKGYSSEGIPLYVVPAHSNTSSSVQQIQSINGNNVTHQQPDLMLDGPDYENFVINQKVIPRPVPKLARRNRVENNTAKLCADENSIKNASSMYPLDSRSRHNAKSKGSCDDPLANFFDSDMHSSRRSSARSPDVFSSPRSSVHEQGFSPKYSQQNGGDAHFSVSQLRSNDWNTVVDINLESSYSGRIRQRSGSVSSVHSAPSAPTYRLVDIDTETRPYALSHSESADKLDEIHQMTTKLHVGLKDMSKSIEFLYENMNYKSKKIEQQHLEEISYHRLFKYIANQVDRLTDKNCWRYLLKDLLYLYPDWFVQRKAKLIDSVSFTTGEKVHECLILWREYNQSTNDQNKITALKQALENIHMPSSIMDEIDDIISINDSELSNYANVLTDQKLSNLALEIGKEWRLLAIFLGHSHQYTERLNMDFPGNSGAAIQKMLFDWRRIHNSNVDMLVKAFISVERKDLVEKLYTVYQLIKKS